MPGRRKRDYAPHIEPEAAPACFAAGCAQPGMYKAPRSREALNDYCWFCLDHIRERNKEWDYFAGLDAAQIEHFMQDAAHGHRPTWTRESHMRHPMSRLQDALNEFFSAGPTLRRSRPDVPLNLRRALESLELEYPYSQASLKRQYRRKVKQTHPDLNKGDKEHEARFKEITAAYQLLAQTLKKS